MRRDDVEMVIRLPHLSFFQGRRSNRRVSFVQEGGLSRFLTMGIKKICIRFSIVVEEVFLMIGVFYHVGSHKYEFMNIA